MEGPLPSKPGGGASKATKPGAKGTAGEQAHEAAVDESLLPPLNPFR